MSLQARLTEVVEDIGADIKSLNDRLGDVTNIVAAPAGTLASSYPDGTMTYEF